MSENGLVDALRMLELYGSSVAPKLFAHSCPNSRAGARLFTCVTSPHAPSKKTTGKSGEFTKIDDTIRSFEEICDGKWDHLPEDAFMYVGPIEQAEEQAKRLAKGGK